MPDPPTIAEQGAAAHEQFIRENREIDIAWATARLNQWLEEKLADERCAAGSDSIPPD